MTNGGRERGIYNLNTYYSTLVTNFFVSLILLNIAAILAPQGFIGDEDDKTRNYGDCLIMSGSWFPDELTCNAQYITIIIIMSYLK